MTARSFLLPDLGEGLTEAEVVRWFVSVGDVVAVDEPVAEVETAKTSVEVPCPHAGTVTQLHAAPGDVVLVGAPLITVAGVDFGIGEPDAPSSASPPSRSSLPSVPSNDVVDGDGDDEGESGPVLVGYGTRRRSQPRPNTDGQAGTPVPRQTARYTAVPQPIPRPPATPEAEAGRTPVVSPLVRRIAREHGIDATTVTGTGDGGLVLRRDVEAVIAARGGAVNGAGSAPAAASTVPDATVERIPLRGAQRAMAEHLTRSRQEIPEATVWVDVDATEFLATRDAINAAVPDRPVSLLALLARFCVAGLRRYPILNATVDTAGGEILRHSRIHLGVAAHTSHGLVVPVVRDVAAMSTRDLAQAVSETVAAARERSLPPGEYVGGTFTVNNYGVFGVDGSAPIINHPEAAMVGMGRITRRPWVVRTSDGEQVRPRSATTLSLVFDHRVCDGGTAGGFLRFVADCVERPQALIGEF